MRTSAAALALLCTCLTVPAHASASEDDDLAALDVADQAAPKVAPPSDVRLWLEAGAGQVVERYDAGHVQTQRAALDFMLDKALAPGWRVLFSDRLDWGRQNREPNESKVNSLRELYLSWQSAAGDAVDLGRINTRYGVAMAYNPTDFFRAGANRAVVSLDPQALRSNRLGAVMLRGQTLWNGGALTVLLSPKLADAPSTAPFSPDLGATNYANRGELVLSQKLADDFAPQFMLYSEAGRAPQFGLNVTRLLGESTSLFAEWSGGRTRAPLLPASDPAWRNRAAAGLTYTSGANVSVTVEADYNGNAADARQWRTLGAGPVDVYQRYRLGQQQQGDLATHTGLFVMVSMPDLGTPHFDVTGFVRRDMVDQSRLTWIEARYHWTRTDFAMQLQHNAGRAMSDFGALPVHTAVQGVLTVYF